MIVLDTTAKSLEIVLSGAVSTNQLDYNVIYYDVPAQTQEGIFEYRRFSTQGNTNSTTAVTMVSAPSNPNVSRVIESIFVYNKDTGTDTVQIHVDVSGTDYILIKNALSTGKTLFYERNDGWTII